MILRPCNVSDADKMKNDFSDNAATYIVHDFGRKKRLRKKRRWRTVGQFA
jgi:hypothetical protein